MARDANTLPPDAVPPTAMELSEAWAKVRRNHGCAGADGLSVAAFERGLQRHLDRLRAAIAEGRYRPFPLLPITIEKRPIGQRRLLIPTVRDRVVQTMAARRIRAEVEDIQLDVSFAYRPGRGVDQAIARLRMLRDHGFTWLVDADIEGFFDNIDPSMLLVRLDSAVSDSLARWLVRRWLRQRVWTGSSLLPLSAGIPQGSPMSPMLANVFLMPFDQQLATDHWKLVRFADDFVVLTRTRPEAEQALKTIKELLSGLGLRLNDSKTRVTSFAETFTFLGARFTETEILIPWDRKARSARIVKFPPMMPAAIRRSLQRELPSRQRPRDGRRWRVRGRVEVQPRTKPTGVKGPPMPILYVTQQGAVIRKSGQRLLVERSGDILLDEPISRFEAVVLLGGVQVTSHAAAALVDAGLRVAYLTRHGALRAMLVPDVDRRVHIRLKQYERYVASDTRLQMARAFVAAKVRAAREVLVRYRRNGGEVCPLALEQLESADSRIGVAGNIAVLMGIEGSAARNYFQQLMQQNKSSFTWAGRRRRPSRDPINALLSLGYTLVGNELRALCFTCGLDPCLGFLHTPEDGRPALALDLLEICRHPIVDRLTLTVINRGIFKADDFRGYDDPDGLFLETDAFKRYARAYEEWMEEPPPANSDDPRPMTRRDAVKTEVLRLVSTLDRDAPYEPGSIPV